MNIYRFKRDLFMRNQFDRVKHVYTMQIIRVKPVLFMINRFEQVNRSNYYAD